MTNNIIKDNWLSEIMGRDAYKLVVDESLVAQTKNFFPKWLEKFKGLKIFIYSKVPTNQLSCAHFLEKSGFNLIDTNVTLKKLPGLEENFKLVNNCKLRFTEPRDEKQVVNLAKNNFRFSRFHLDPLVDNSIADCIKGKWVENYYRGKRGDELIVATVAEKIAGFLLLIKDGQKLIIDLIAVDSKYQGRKIASDMIIYAESLIEHAEVIVGTQATNIPSIRLYESLGFKMFSSEYVFHFHQ